MFPLFVSKVALFWRRTKHRRLKASWVINPAVLWSESNSKPVHLFFVGALMMMGDGELPLFPFLPPYFLSATVLIYFLLTGFPSSHRLRCHLSSSGLLSFAPFHSISGCPSTFSPRPSPTANSRRVRECVQWSWCHWWKNPWGRWR